MTVVMSLVKMEQHVFSSQIPFMDSHVFVRLNITEFIAKYVLQKYNFFKFFLV